MNHTDGELCERCRKLISERTIQAMKRAAKRGAHIGRPKQHHVSAHDLQQVRDGKLTVNQLAQKIKCSVVTIRRRLKRSK